METCEEQITLNKHNFVLWQDSGSPAVVFLSLGRLLLLDILVGKLGHTVTTLVRKTLQEQLLMFHVSWKVYQEGILQESVLHLVLLNILNFYLADSSEKR